MQLSRITIKLQLCTCKRKKIGRVTIKLLRVAEPKFRFLPFSRESESESELFTGDTSKDNHSPGPVFREVSP